MEKRRFRIVKLEERIAPSACGVPKGGSNHGGSKFKGGSHHGGSKFKGGSHFKGGSNCGCNPPPPPPCPCPPPPCPPTHCC
jgi:hypothetical protein